MKPQTKCRSSWSVMITVLLPWIMVLSTSASDQSTPPPKPGTLGAYAQLVTLDRSAVRRNGPLVLTNEDVASVARGAAITLGSVTSPALAKPATSNRTDDAERERWTRAHHKQRQVIAALEQRRALVKIDVDVLDDQRPTPKLLARLEQARAKLRHIEQQIAHEKEVLARIVRQARQHGAQPDWFR